MGTKAQPSVNKHMLPQVSHQASSLPGPSLRDYGRLLGITIIIGAIHGWAWQGTGMDLTRIARGAPLMVEFLSQLFPPNWEVTQTVMGAALETLQIAIIGTSASAILALPMGFCAANNVAPPLIRNATRTILNAIRSIPLILYALFFVVAVGLGPLAGTLAIIIYSTGMLGKFYSEAIETIDPKTVEGIFATGANRLQALRYGVLPQVLPYFVGYALYRLEINFREATILGLVGAGGIGFYITLYMRSFAYHRIATVTLIILVMVILIDALSSYLRAKLT